MLAFLEEEDDEEESYTKFVLRILEHTVHCANPVGRGSVGRRLHFACHVMAHLVYAITLKLLLLLSFYHLVCGGLLQG